MPVIKKPPFSHWLSHISCVTYWGVSWSVLVRGKIKHDAGIKEIRKCVLLASQVAQARNMTIGEHRHCCVTFEI